MLRCNRPTTQEIRKFLVEWYSESCNGQSEIGEQIKEAKEINNSLPTN
jgi:hypothetical protein